jgi:hypothetical protein
MSHGLAAQELLRICTTALRQADTNSPGLTVGGMTWEWGMCTGYLMGWLSGYTWDKLLCLPSGVTLEQLVRVVVQYVQDHPQRLHERSNGLIHDAIQTAFPCASVPPPPPAPSKRRQR